MVYILNFNNSRDLSDIKSLFDDYGKTNINFLIEGFADGNTNWSVPKSALPRDIVIFMCAVSARTNLGLATSHIPDNYSQEFKAFVDRQKNLYKQYSGCILGYGIVTTDPEYDDQSGWWTSDIGELCQFSNPIHFDDYKSFVSINTFSSVTNINNEQWERLKWLINQSNPGTFENVDAPYEEALEQEFKEDVKKEEKKPFEKLSKEAEKKASKPIANTVRTTVYHRDPTIAAFVKRRANGYCQLCGSKAPFDDQNGVPYLECHHIEWLSKGGMDSADNCVALCPNCHRKMHIINDPDDIKKLKAAITQSSSIK